jgi:hypothetical protein
VVLKQLEVEARRYYLPRPIKTYATENLTLVGNMGLEIPEARRYTYRHQYP